MEFKLKLIPIMSKLKTKLHDKTKLIIINYRKIQLNKQIKKIKKDNKNKIKYSNILIIKSSQIF